jgi:PAS domain S-box-containing protein
MNDNEIEQQKQAARMELPVEGAALPPEIESVKETQNFFQKVFIDAPIMMYILDLDGRFVLFNRCCEKVSGYSAAEVKGRLLSEVLLLPEERQSVMRVFHKLRQGNFPVDNRNAWITKDGKVRQTQWTNSAALVDVDGKPRFVLAMGEDVTEEVNRLASMKELENRFTKIFQASPVGIGLVRCHDLIVLDANRSLLRLLERERGNVVGFSAEECGLFPSNSARELVDMVQRQGVSGDREWRILVSGRKQLNVLVSFEMIEWSQDLALLVMVRDITERVQSEEVVRRLNNDLEWRVLERTRALEAINREKRDEVEYRKAVEVSSQRLSQIIWEAPDIIAMCEANGRFLYINKAGRRLFNLGETEAVHHLSVFDAYPKDQVQRVQNEISPAVTQFGSWKGEIELQIPNGKRIPILQTILPHYSAQGDLEFYSTIIHDITEEKLAAEEIKRAYEAEKELGQMRSNFFAMTSHQFRTPLSTILSSAEILEHYGMDWGDEKRLFHLRRIQDQAQTLNQMLNSLLEAARLGQRPAESEYQSLDLCAQVEDCVNLIRSANQEKRTILFSCSPEMVPVWIVPDLVDQVVDNLLSNAVKYSPESQPVSVRVYSTDGWAVLEVDDHGIGITDEDQQLLFQPFFRGSNVGDIQGNGLGLTIVKRAVDLLGGKIEVSSRIGEGTTVNVRFPRDGQNL